MSGPVDGFAIFQWAALIMPTLAILGVFVRLGAVSQEFRSIRADVHKLAEVMERLTVLTARLEAYQQSQGAVQADILARITRVEGRVMFGKHDGRTG